MKSFYQDCYSQLKKVPKGRITTYKALANSLNSKAYRAVGSAMNKNPNAPSVPCHRVVNSNGEIGEYAFGVKKKVELLKKEGVLVKNGRIVDFEKKLFNKFS